MKVEIIVQDSRGSEEAEKMGLEWEPKFSKTWFHFRLSLLESFWIDDTAEDWEIVFSIGGSDYRAPYKVSIAETFQEELECLK